MIDRRPSPSNVSQKTGYFHDTHLSVKCDANYLFSDRYQEQDVQVVPSEASIPGPEDLALDPSRRCRTDSQRCYHQLLEVTNRLSIAITATNGTSVPALSSKVLASTSFRRPCSTYLDQSFRSPLSVRRLHIELR